MNAGLIYLVITNSRSKHGGASDPGNLWAVLLVFVAAVALPVIVVVSVAVYLDHRTEEGKTNKFHRSAMIVETFPELEYSEKHGKSRHYYTPVRIKENSNYEMVSFESPVRSGTPVYKDCWTDKKGSWCDGSWSFRFKYENLSK